MGKRGKTAIPLAPDGVRWKRSGQLQVTSLPCLRSAEVLIVKATVCKLPAVFRYPVDELFQNARHRFCLNDLKRHADGDCRWGTCVVATRARFVGDVILDTVAHSTEHLQDHTREDHNNGTHGVKHCKGT